MMQKLFGKSIMKLVNEGFCNDAKIIRKIHHEMSEWGLWEKECGLPLLIFSCWFKSLWSLIVSWKKSELNKCVHFDAQIFSFSNMQKL